MTLLEHLRQWSESTEEWKQLVDLHNQLDRLPDSPGVGSEHTERLNVMRKIADLVDAYADRMERSGLVRAWASSFTPDRLRADAAVWRSGRNPHDD